MKYKQFHTQAKINTTQALRIKLQIQKAAVKDCEKGVAYMLQQNKKRLGMARALTRKQRIEPGKSQAKKNLINVTRRSKLRLAVPLKSLHSEKKKLDILKNKIKRFQKNGQCYTIL